MSARVRTRAFQAAALAALIVANPAASLGQPARTAATSQGARARADALVARMTLDEKIALLHGLFPPMAKGKTANELIPSAGHIDGIPRLGIPIVRETDASLGVANQVEQRKGDVATALPSSLATATNNSCITNPKKTTANQKPRCWRYSFHNSCRSSNG